MLSWNMAHSQNVHAALQTFQVTLSVEIDLRTCMLVLIIYLQIYAYQENPSQPAATITSSLWKKLGDVNALPLPMACTLTQFQAGHKYHFTVR